MNKTEERRKKILKLLTESREAINGTSLAEKFGVSRQVIVQDIAILKSQHKNIVATNRGYLLFQENLCRKIVKVRHSNEEIEKELNAIVDLGARIEDVVIEHKAYGKLKGQLEVSSRRDVKKLIENIEEGISKPLLHLTKGYHFHTLVAENMEILMEAEEKLRELGFLIEE